MSAVPTERAIEALETWIEVFDGAVLNGHTYPEAEAQADEVLRVAGPHPSRAVVTSLSDVLKEYYLPTNEPGAVMQYDPYDDIYRTPDGRRVTGHAMRSYGPAQIHLPPATLPNVTARH